jgi:hypothetical protein
MDKVLRTKDLEHTVLEYHKNYVISTVKEDVVVGHVEVNSYIKVCTEFYKDTNFLYISLRKNNYNVNPVIYPELVKDIRGLRGIGIVCPQASKISTAKFESSFVDFPFEIFTALDDAVEWARELTKV